MTALVKIWLWTRKLGIEVKVVFVGLAVIVGLPIFAVISMTSAGLAPVSAALVAIDKVTHIITVKDARGNVLRTLEATTAWPSRGVVTTEFGGTTNFQKFHSGIDIAGKKGDPITVFMTGTVTHVEHDPKKSGLGIHVIVDHGNGISSKYGHMSVAHATEGQTVNPGDVIGEQGNTGNVQREGGDGTHLHFEIRVSELPVEPRTFFIGDPPR